jgi:hypothetical protein
MCTLPLTKCTTLTVSTTASGTIGTKIFRFFCGFVLQEVTQAGARDTMGAGLGTQPGSASSQPDRNASVMTVFAMSSVTQAAES